VSGLGFATKRITSENCKSQTLSDLGDLQQHSHLPTHTQNGHPKTLFTHPAGLPSELPKSEWGLGAPILAGEQYLTPIHERELDYAMRGGERGGTAAASSGFSGKLEATSSGCDDELGAGG
jgi:hypothetical protein